MNIILSFLTGFIVKYFSGPAIEKVVLILLKKLVETTESKIDNEIYNALFNKIEISKD